jgi:hypothetical protein
MLKHSFLINKFLALLIAFSISRLGNARALQNAVPNPMAASGQELNPFTPVIPIPAGYLDAMAPDSPAVEFFEDLKQDWGKREITPRGLISVLVKASEVEAYYNGGPNPLDTQYFYICFLESKNTGQEMASFKKNITMTSDKPVSDIGKMIKKLKLGQMFQFGILEDWGSGFIFGNVANSDAQAKYAKNSKARLLLTAVVANPHGGCFINDQSLIENELDLKAALGRLEGLARRIEAANASPTKE